MKKKEVTRRFSLRIPPSMFEKLSTTAERNRRSVNDEILLAIDEHLVKANASDTSTKPN